MRRNRAGKKRPAVGGIICLLAFTAIGIFMMVQGVRSAERYKTLSERCTEQTTGTVTAINTKRTEKEDEDGNIVYDEYNIITVTFYVHNEPYTVKAKDSIQTYERNEELAVCYAPDDPNVSYIEELMPDNDQMFLTLLGVFCIGLGLLILMIAK